MSKVNYFIILRFLVRYSIFAVRSQEIVSLSQQHCLAERPVSWTSSIDTTYPINSDWQYDRPATFRQFLIARRMNSRQIGAATWPPVASWPMLFWRS